MANKTNNSSLYLMFHMKLFAIYFCIDYYKANSAQITIKRCLTTSKI